MTYVKYTARSKIRTYDFMLFTFLLSIRNFVVYLWTALHLSCDSHMLMSLCFPLDQLSIAEATPVQPSACNVNYSSQFTVCSVFVLFSEYQINKSVIAC